MTALRIGSISARVLLGAATAIVACANRPAGTDDPSPAQPTVQVVERKPMPAPSFLPIESTKPKAATTFDASMFSCSDSAECVVIETGCCDHCNGGSLLAVNGQHSESAIEAFRQRSCDDASCTKMACEWSYTPVCDAGTCARLEERPMGSAAAQSIIVHNEVPAGG